MSVKITMNANWTKVQQGKWLQGGLLEMATDIHRRASAFAPVDTGALRNSGRIDSVNDGYKITYGSSRVPYARRRHFENKKNPQTLGYLAKAGDSVVRGNTSKYWRNKI
jgi:hypothetical protein